MEADKLLNRLEIIDHRKCSVCNGVCWITKEGEKPYECKECQGMGSKGRIVVVGGPAYGKPDNTTISTSYQDDFRTLKIFIKDKE